MLKSLFVIILIVAASVVVGQDRFFTKTGHISFHSKTNVEDIDAYNRSVSCVLDTKTGSIQFAVVMKGFEFKKALMQEHFNENYVESDKYPKSVFKGQISNNASINYTTPGTYPLKVKGQLTIHGETNEIETDGTMTVKDGKIISASEFQVAIADYKISVPALVKDNISKTINIRVSCTLEPLK
jgi:polyisoprenoid-binding protein YceI